MQVRDNKDGTYSVGYVPQTFGSGMLSVQLRGEHIQGSPFELEIDGPTELEASGAGLVEGKAGQVAHFTIECRTRSGELIDVPQPLSKSIDVTIVHNEQGTAVAAKLSNDPKAKGTYSVDWVPELMGEYTIDITVLSQHVPHSPFVAYVTCGAVDARHCTASGPGLVGATALQQAEFSIFAADAYGNPVSDAEFDVQLSGPQKVSGSVQPSDGNNSYPASYTAMCGGQYQIHVTTGGRPISGSPFTVSVQKGPPDSQHCSASGEGLVRARAGEEAQFQLIVRTTADEMVDLPDLADVFSELSYFDGSKEVAVSATRSEMGKYVLKYTPLQAGRGSIIVEVMDGGVHKHVPGSPFDVLVEAGDVDAMSCTAFGPGLVEATSKQDAIFTIQARDKFQNLIEGASGVFKVEYALKHRTGSDKGAGKVADEGAEGEYGALYSVQRSGTCMVHVSAVPRKGGKAMPISGSPFEVPVSAGAIVPGRCSAKGAGLASAKCGEAARFVVSIRAESGEAVPLPEGDGRALLVTLNSSSETAGIDGVIGRVLGHRLLPWGNGLCR